MPDLLVGIAGWLREALQPSVVGRTTVYAIVVGAMRAMRERRQDL